MSTNHSVLEIFIRHSSWSKPLLPKFHLSAFEIVFLERFSPIRKLETFAFPKYQEVSAPVAAFALSGLEVLTVCLGLSFVICAMGDPHPPAGLPSSSGLPSSLKVMD